jgi:hypothetical protein
METRKRQNTGAGKEGLIPRKKDKEEHKSVRVAILIGVQ